MTAEANMNHVFLWWKNGIQDVGHQTGNTPIFILWTGQPDDVNDQALVTRDERINVAYMIKNIENRRMRSKMSTAKAETHISAYWRKTMQRVY